MFDWIVSHTPAWNSIIALLLYWLPLALCLVGYFLRGVKEYRLELNRREKYERPENHPFGRESPNIYFYTPSLTVGVIVGHLFLTVCPIANLFAAIFDVAPDLFSGFFRWCGRVLDIPLVPKRKNGDG